MRRVLVLGGTGWLGREVARAARDGGAEVVCLARGESGAVPDGVELIRANRRAPGAYDEVAGDWDDVIEFAYEPELVGPALDALAERAAHWTLISSVSVYADNATPHADETADVVVPQDLSQYPDAKAAAEQATASRLADRLLIARPGLIVGPGDPSDRFGYWPARLRRGGRVLHPTVAGRFVQVIDVADLARWTAHAGGNRVTGTVDAVGAIHTMADFFSATRASVGFDGELVSADDDALLAEDVRYWAGPRSLPLWLPRTDAGFAQRDGSAFLRSGGSLRPLTDTLSRVLADEVDRGIERARRSGLTSAEEDAVLQRLL
ncbi:reductase [Microbacterium betulae]|uniref:Reductase n=1 Tax=Microbacterium betulae TaxID=2981139 RepID=A0AA97I6Q5_9MICO|nr:reductase [Microbacterium sp. AB]WOF23397.1 reductase [Microbacterium sp. AB]